MYRAASNMDYIDRMAKGGQDARQQPGTTAWRPGMEVIVEEHVSGNGANEGMPKEVVITILIVFAFFLFAVYLNISPLSPASIESLKAKDPCYAEFMRNRLTQGSPVTKFSRVEMLYECALKASVADRAMVVKGQKEALGIEG